MKSRVPLELDLKPGWRHDNLGRLFLEGWGYFERALMSRIHDAGFTTIRRVHFNVLRNLDFDGTRIVDLAARGGITKGSMGQIVKDCEKLGIVTLQVDPSDGRAKVVLFAEQGLALMEIIRKAMIDVQTEMTWAMGTEDSLALQRALQALRQHFNQGEDVHEPRPSAHG